MDTRNASVTSAHPPADPIRVPLLMLAGLGAVCCLLPWQVVATEPAWIQVLADGPHGRQSAYVLGVQGWRGLVSAGLFVVVGVGGLVGWTRSPARPGPLAVLATATLAIFGVSLHLLIEIIRMTRRLAEMAAQPNPLAGLFGMFVPRVHLAPGIGLWGAVIVSGSIGLLLAWTVLGLVGHDDTDSPWADSP